jgi:GNAT superfamily N-acetyltransferase
MPDAPLSQISVIPAVNASAILPFVQELILTDASGKSIGYARWHAPEGTDGIVQVLDIAIVPAYQRQGHGSVLIRRIYAEANALFTTVGLKPRRIWLAVEQKRCINARAFLSRHGFHHVSSIKNALLRQDVLIYLRSFD